MFVGAHTYKQRIVSIETDKKQIGKKSPYCETYKKNSWLVAVLPSVLLI